MFNFISSCVEGAARNSQGVGWLSLLGSGDASNDIILSQESFGEGDSPISSILCKWNIQT